MRARLFGGRAASDRLVAASARHGRPWAGGSGRAPDPGRGSRARSHRRPLSHWLLLALGGGAIAAAAVIITSGGKGAGSALGGASGSQSPAAASTPARAQSRTRIRHLPSRRLSDGTAPLTVVLSGTPAPGSPRPRLSPAVAGSWSTSGNREIFKSASTLQPCTHYRMTIPAATTAKGQRRLGKRVGRLVQVSCPPLRGMQVALARLGYLPDSFRPAPGVSFPRAAMDRRKAAHLLYMPPSGQLRPDIAGAPPVQYGAFDPTTKGAVMVFQEDHKLEATGEADQQTWAKLLAAVAHKYRDPQPYTFVTVTESLPETLQVHRGSKVVLTSSTNTGVPGAETEQGVFPIFERLTFQMMKGTDPNGTKYNVPVHWINYFNGGDAVHSYERAGYGYPQSNGCVELPLETGHTVFGMLKLGDIVWVT